MSRKRNIAKLLEDIKNNLNELATVDLTENSIEILEPLLSRERIRIKSHRQYWNANDITVSKRQKTKSSPPNPEDACYICKTTITKQKHQNYKNMCLPCGEKNYNLRNVVRNLSGKIAIVTGGRVKIGYETALRLLRNGCTVIVTTRFVDDCVERYKQDSNYEQFANRLNVYQLNMLSAPNIEKFIQYIKMNFSKIDYLINNAAQTIRRPKQFYQHIIDKITDTITNINASSNANIDVNSNANIDGGSNTNVDSNVQHDTRIVHRDMNELQLLNNSLPSMSMIENKNNDMNELPLMIENINDNINDVVNNDVNDIVNNDIVNNDIVNNDVNDDLRDNNVSMSISSLFPEGKFDEYGQQLDLRPINSWVLSADQINLVELAEVYIINTIAPFMLATQLKPLMKKMNGDGHSWIINVSSMEGVFYRKRKPIIHPHTNMAKAALNMFTRTSGKDFFESNIVMVAVNTGWNNPQEPNSYNVRTPLDCVDGAARILHPIYNKLTAHSMMYTNFERGNW